VVALAAALVVLAVGLSPAGAKVANLFQDVTGIGHQTTRPALTSLPASGRLLVTSRDGAWVVSEDGSMRFLGDYTNATWSPHGLFVAATRGRQLSAIAPDGTPHWSLAQRHRVSDPRWSPSGYRVAYLGGDSLRVVVGDGSGDRSLESPVAHVAPAWKPVTPATLQSNSSGVGTHLLAFVTASGRVAVINSDSGKLLWTSGTGATPSMLEWSPDRKHLLALDSSGWRVFTPGGKLLTETRVAPAGRPVSASFSPTDDTFALVEAQKGLGPARSSIYLVHGESGRLGKPLLTLPGRVAGATWSPNGRRLLIAWRDADQWLFLDPTRAPNSRQVTAVSHVSRQFQPGGQGEGAFPQPRGWCCTR
jgi:dipeptidyl aminopeptidase/acylaminoacyl peptidase